MREPSAQISELLAKLRSQTDDKFTIAIIGGAERSLEDNDNPLRVNFFATGMRILFEHTLERLSPDAEVKKCAWFKVERENGALTRAQRVIYAVQGGLTDAFVSDELCVDVPKLRKKLVSAIDGLSKHIHGRPDTVVKERAAQDEFIMSTLNATSEFFETLEMCRQAIIKPIDERLDDAAVNALTNETLLAIDELSTHHSIEEVYTETVSVHHIGPHAITYRAEGTISAVLQWGSNSDVRRGDGVELEDSFPFTCDIEVPIESPWNLDDAETTYSVDNSEWRDPGDQDEDVSSRSEDEW